jgi:superfamily I DNA/RNA helicase
VLNLACDGVVASDRNQNRLAICLGTRGHDRVLLRKANFTVSVFNGPEPIIEMHTDVNAEMTAVGQWISQAVADGVSPSEIGVFVRTRKEIDRARAAVFGAGYEVLELSERGDAPTGRISIGTMHLAKGLEFKAVAIMACDDEVLPLQSRIESVADEVDLDDVYETERQLLYVACTRARDRLLITAVKPGSEFLKDLGSA